MATTDSPPGARNTDYAQALALAGLLAGASLSLSRLYAGNAWLLPTWLTMAAALGLAALLRRLGVGQLLSLLAMVVGFVVVGGILLFPGTLLLVVPTGRTLSEMAAAASAALTAVSEQAAPVQVTTEFVLLTCAGAWAVATAADGLAFRARQPLLALVPALGLFVFPAVIRPSSPAWYTTWFLLGAAGMLLFEGRARLATWGRWVSSARSRPGAGWRLPLTPAAQTGRWLALAAGLCALTVPWLLPGYGQQPVVDLKERAGADAGVALNPFISLRTRLTAQEDVPMFRARTTQRERWRLMVYDRFDGTDFAPSSDPRGNLVAFEGPLAGEQDPDLPVTQVTQEVEIQELGSFWLPAATTPVRVDAGRPVLANQTFASLTINQRLREGFRYTVVSQVPSIDAADLDGPVDYRDYPQPAALPRDRQPGPGGAAAGRDGGRGQERRHPLREGPGHPGLPAQQGVPLQPERALARGRRQPAAALPDRGPGGLLRAVRHRHGHDGPPGRRPLPGGGRLHLRRDRRQHLPAGHHPRRPRLAGAVVPQGRLGAVRADPAGRRHGLGAHLHHPGRPGAGRRRGHGQPARHDRPGLDHQPAPPGPPSPAPADNSDPLAGAGTDRGWLERPVVRAGLAVVLLVLLVPGVKWARNLLARRRAGRRPRDAVAESYAELTSWASDAGIGRRRAETPAAYARRLHDDFAADADPLVELTGLFERAEYAPAEPGGRPGGHGQAAGQQRQVQPGRPARLAPAAAGHGQPPQPARRSPASPAPPARARGAAGRELAGQPRR